MRYFNFVQLIPLFLMSICSLGQNEQAAGGEKKLHLFILSGQSNMAGLDPALSFTPTVKAALGEDSVIVCKDGYAGQPIRRWYKQWKADDEATGQGSESALKIRETFQKGNPKAVNGDLFYNVMMDKVNSTTHRKKIASVTFVWMQGEEDAAEAYGNVYLDSLNGVLKQLKEELKREDINFVVGRLSDYDMENKRFPDWTSIREAQVKFAESSPWNAWVDTDDLNGDKNDLHYTSDGYKELGRRFAEKALMLLKKRMTEEDKGK